MSRPMASYGIEELEALFEIKGTTDAELEVLENELSHRSTTRAGSLLIKVRKRQKVKALVASANARLSAKHIAQVDPLGLDGTISEADAPNSSTLHTTMQESIRQSAFHAPKSASASTELMTDEQVYRYLKVPSSAGWEQVEQSRREIVARSQPDRLEGLTTEKRKSLQDEGRLANAAFMVLLRRQYIYPLND